MMRALFGDAQLDTDLAEAQPFLSEFVGLLATTEVWLPAAGICAHTKMPGEQFN
jgi:hypothetical protein